MKTITRRIIAAAAAFTIAAASIPMADYLPVSTSVSAYAASSLSESDIAQFEKDWSNHDYVLKKGLWANSLSSGKRCIKDAQKMLEFSLGVSMDIDGKFGSDTKNKTKDFQRQYGLNADGIIGCATWDKLVSVCRDIISRNQQSSIVINSGYDYETVISNMYADLGKDGSDLGYYVAWCAYYVCDQLRRAGVDISREGNPCDLVLAAVNNGMGTYYNFRDKNYDSLVYWGLNSTGKQRVVRTSRDYVTPQRGDIIIYRWSDESSAYNWSHTGIVTGYSNGTVYTVEGNTGSYGTVMTRSRDYNYEVVGLLRL